MRYHVALVAALVLNATANLMMKFGVLRLKESGASLEKGWTTAVQALMSNWVLLLGLVCFASNVVLYTYALSRVPISIAYPIMVSGGFAIIAVVAWLHLGERMSWGQWAGVGCILFGVYLIARDMSAVKVG